jgi:hypothetical protein
MNSDAQVGDDFQICDRFSLGDLSRMFYNLATMGSTGQQRQLLSCKYRIMDVPLTSPARFSACFALGVKSGLAVRGLQICQAVTTL